MDRHEKLCEEKAEAYNEPYIRRTPLYKHFGTHLHVDVFGYAVPNHPHNLSIGRKRSKRE